MAYPIRTFAYAVVVYVVDGDTCDIDLDLGFSVKMKTRFRLARINTPEIGQPGAAEAKAYLTKYVGKSVVLQVTKIDKYGRYLAEIFPIGEEVSVNQRLLDLGLAQPYAS